MIKSRLQLCDATIRSQLQLSDITVRSHLQFRDNTTRPMLQVGYITVISDHSYSWGHNTVRSQLQLGT